MISILRNENLGWVKGVLEYRKGIGSWLAVEHYLKN